MAKTTSNKKRWLKWGGLAAVVVIAAFVGFKFWKKKQSALPDGIASGNGRIEAKLVDIAAKEPLRVKQMMVDEGAVVKRGQVVVQMDTSTLQSELATAQAQVSAAQEKLIAARAGTLKQKSEIRLAEIEAERSHNLLQQRAGSQRELDVRRTKVETTKASLNEADAEVQTATREVEAAQATAATVQTRIDDATLRSPVSGRVLYRLAEPGEVLAAGGKALTLVNLEDVYMEIFLPSQQAADLKVGAEGRITVDFQPDRAVAGYVSFVSPEAQFTPKQVETKSEREKLMFRVKIQVPKEVASQYIQQIKTGVRGMGYVKVKSDAVWPARLNNLANPTAVGLLTE
ncbi:MAG TPA: HlyD family efflux transporter periplasmic adaptor subunit [Polyangia bacterium]|nr:HlyD family efflux transporter periplasmic adaptor subunit [Polyangia bacterium]